MSNCSVASVGAGSFAVALGSNFASADMLSEADMMKMRTSFKKEVA